MHAGSWEIKLNVSMNKMNCDESSLFMHLLIPTVFSRKWQSLRREIVLKILLYLIFLFENEIIDFFLATIADE